MTMLQNKDSQDTAGSCSAVLFIFITTLFALALLSFTPEDIVAFSSDYGSPHYPANLLGLLGAHIIWGLLLTFGFGTYALFGLLVISSIRRLFLLKLLRKTRWDYYFALFLFMFASSLLTATWHSVFGDWAARINLATLPGGVLGDFICGPSGFLLYILNKVGITILCGLCYIVSLCLIAFYDWGPFFRIFRRKHTSEQEETRADESEDEEEKAEPVSSGRARSSRNRSAASGSTATIQQELPLDTPDEPPMKKDVVESKVSQKSAAKAVVSATAPDKKANGTEEVKYVLPPSTLLEDRASDDQTAASAQEIQTNQERLQAALDSFHIDGTVVNSVPGPQVTLFKIKLSNGVKVESVKGIENNIKMNLKASSVRLLTPIPGEDLIGVEVPNKVLKSVSVRAMVEDRQWIMSDYQIPILLGKNISGRTICIDLARAPHLLIAGATGTGKSVCMNLIIISLLYKHSPETLRLIMVDPKKVEFSIYHDLPHLLVPVITENSKVSLALKWACNEMDRRYRILQAVGCRDIKSFNNRPKRDNEPLDDEGKPLPAKLPFIVIIIDELADIMLTSKNEVEGSLSRIAALARAVGIHAILATQRPDVKVITGTIKANFPVRISFRVASPVDSMTIIGSKGAEALLGMGDMLYKPAGIGMERIQGGMASDEERNRVVEYITSQYPPPEFDLSILAGDDHEPRPEDDESPVREGTGDTGDESNLFERAIDIVFHDRKTSISYIQRRLKIGYNKAATLVEELEEAGIIGPKNGTANAEILMTDEEYYARRGGNVIPHEDDDSEEGDETPEDVN